MQLRYQRSFLKSAAALGAAAAFVAAAPASAENAPASDSPAVSTTAGVALSADIGEAAREARIGHHTSGDVRFRELFASWTSLDEAGPGAPIAQPAVAIPSRMPLDGARMSSGYGMRDHPVLRKRKRHNGIDLAAPTGTPVYATADGIVGRADRFSSYGLYVSIDHGAELETRYAHMSRLAVSAGDRVRKGDIVGYVGSTGRSTGPHLHYEVRVDGMAVNPIPYMVETDVQIAMENDLRRAGAGGP